jgi:arylsulfatase A-like enzyme
MRAMRCDAAQALAQHDAAAPIFIHLCFEAVHSPYDPVPARPANLSVYQGMLWRADLYVGALYDLLQSKGMWANALVVYSADNGGVGGGINWPLRGEKHSSWEGGLRTAAFVSGGLVPAALRGSSSGVNMHLADWYATFCGLAGVAPSDDPPEPPLPADPSKPFNNIYGEKSYPPLDSRDVWPALMQPDTHNSSAAHTYLVLTKEVLIAGRHASPFRT